MIILNQDNIWLRVRYISSQDTSSETHDQTRIRLQSIYVCGAWRVTQREVFQPYKAREFEDDGRNRF